MIPDYVQALCQEIYLAGLAAESYHAGAKPAVHTVFFGGGTPSLLPIADLERIIRQLRDIFDLVDNPEITLEANPGTVSLDFLRDLHSLGVNRLSLGMQSAHPSDLMVLERQHQLEDVVKAVRWARQAGFTNLNLDLIFGIPYQTQDSWQRSLAMALSMQPEHLALYALTLEHGTPMAHWVNRGLVPEVDTDTAADMYQHAMEKLATTGYEQYEISNWAGRRDGDLLACRHNLQYWRSQPYLGFGAGAHGFVRGYRTVNVLAPALYIKRLGEENNETAFPRTPATTELIAIDDASARGELMMMGLRLVEEGVKDADYFNRFGQTLEEVYPRQIRRLIQLGLLEWCGTKDEGRSLRLTVGGRLLGNRVFREFI